MMPSLELRVPAELVAADLGAIRTRAAEHLGDAAVARDQAASLRAAVVRLVPAAWLGLGSLSFAAAALGQAESLEAVAAASSELGTALQVLGTALEVSRRDAEDAVRAAQRLETELAVAAGLWLRRPEPERIGPDPTRSEVAVTTSRHCTSMLAAALEAARTAWRRAGAAFDLVAYRMPDLARRMRGTAGGAADGWRPSTGLVALPTAAWRSMVGASPVCVDAGWSGGGALVGPDGRQYPLVVPWVTRDGHRYTADTDADAGGTGSATVASLDGADTGWHELATRVGIDEFGPPAATADKAAIVLAGLAGKAPQTLGRLRPDLLGRLDLSPAGVADLDAAPGVPGRTGSAGTGQLPRSALVPTADGGIRWVGDTSAKGATDPRAVRRGVVGEQPQGRAAPAGPNVIGLADQTLAAAGTAGHLDDNRDAGYRVVFEENEDGRRRARLTLYQVRSDDSGTQVLTTDASLTPDGALQRPAVSYRTAG